MLLLIMLASMPGSAMCLGLKQIMKANNKTFQNKITQSSLIKPRQPEGVCRQGT